ncbi:MAG: 30S ribosomal protein S11 [Candidatus Kuenenbacteria bacterium]
MAEKKTVKRKKKQVIRRLLKGRGRVYIRSSYNNTIVSIADQNGNVIAQSSSGRCGFKSAKKATPYAAGVVVRAVVDKAKDAGVREADVYVKGIGPARESAIRALAVNGIQIVGIKDITPVPHNGCRPRRPRRV